MFAEHAHEYIDAGLAVFPVGGEHGKRPLIKNPQRIGLSASLELAAQPKFSDFGLGAWCGPRNGLTILDIDVADQRVFEDALCEYGDTPIKVQTATGKFHAWYRHNGENRHIRPDGLEGDILGAGGFAVVPPSERAGVGSYYFLEGSLKDLNNLPVMRGGERFRKGVDGRRKENTVTPQLLPAPNLGAVFEGQRDNFIFREARIFASTANCAKAVYDYLAAVNAERCFPPLSDAIIANKARHVWDIKQQGTLILPGERAAVLHLDVIAALSAKPSALALWSFLKAHHAPHHEIFIVPDGISGNGLNLSPRTIWNARKFLVENGFLECVRQTRGGAANLYRFRATM